MTWVLLLVGCAVVIFAIAMIQTVHEGRRELERREAEARARALKVRQEELARDMAARRATLLTDRAYRPAADHLAPASRKPANVTRLAPKRRA